MSGIAALIRFDGGPVEPGLIEAMTETMAYRGPDGLSRWSGGTAALGHCMLRTTPEALEETQPLANEDETVVLVMDGRIDNWEELRAELMARGARLRTRADAELVLRAYEACGRDCVHHMEGDFALVVWDARRGEVLCARDRLGHKPFHYHWDGSCLSVASELHAILALPWVEEAMNEGMVAEILADDLCSLDETLWKGIFRLPPAHRMTVDAAGSWVDRYWLPDLDAELRYKREEEYVEHYRALLEGTVRRHSRAQGPLACEVSGGLDSSAVFAVAEALRRKGELPAPSADAYTLRFDGGAAGSDLEYARAVGAHLGCQMHEVPPVRQPLAWYRDWARRYRELPAAPHGTMHLGIYEAAMQHGSRVVLGGVGGDQWLTGDHTYFAASLAAARLDEFLECLRRDARYYGIRRSLVLGARHGIVPLLPLSVRRTGRRALARVRGDGGGSADWLSRELADALAARESRRTGGLELQRPAHRQRLRFLLSGENVFAHELMDRMAASQGVERRSPIDSAEIVQFGFSVPQHWLLRNGWDRYIHRKALSGAWPEVVAWRRSKAEFSVVFEWCRGELNEAINRSIPDLERWVSREGLVRLCTGAEATRPRSLVQLWTLVGCDAVRRSGESSRKMAAEMTSSGYVAALHAARPAVMRRN